MHQQIGFVSEVKDKTAEIIVKKQSSCGENCGMCKAGCAQTVRIRVVNRQDLAVGDKVVLTARAGSVFLLSFLSYLLPLLLFAAVYALTKHEGASALVLVVSFIVCAFAGNRLARKPFFQSNIQKIE